MPTQPTDLAQQLLVSIYVRRDKHENGMTMEEYANGVRAGTQPILDHDAFVYQFGSIKDEIKLVEDWAIANGLTIFESGPGIATVKVHGSAEQFNRLFNITLQTVTDVDRTYTTHEGSIIIPSAINDVVEKVLGLDNKLFFKKLAVEYDPASGIQPTAVTNVTPLEMATAYNFPAGDGYGGCIGIFELTYSGYQTGWSQNDLNLTFAQIGQTAPTPINISVNGAVIRNISDSESILDIYCAGAVAPQATIAYYDAPNSYQGVIDCILAAANDTTNNPSVLSISWALGASVDFDTAIQACTVKGITVLIASGDYGAQNFDMYDPTGISTSPYAIIVGGTTVTLNVSDQITSEVAWSKSGGGISDINSLPTYQSGLTYTTLTIGNVQGPATALPMRGVPDICANADPASGYRFYLQGGLVQYGGTSAAAPLLAGMIVRLNVLMGSRIGNSNDIWYANSGTMFSDIIVGDNVDYNAAGYTTTTGWDAVTGLGSPKANVMYTYFKKGLTFPKSNFGFRRTGTLNYPRVQRPAVG